MQRIVLFIMAMVIAPRAIYAQNTFKYSVELTPVSVPGLPGLHSFAFGQHNGKWLVLGGRRDGLHSRQPVNSFPQSQNNTDIYVIDVNTKAYWSAPLNSLPTSIAEQLQSSNMNFFQQEDTLYLIGGYAYSATASDHKTFSSLTTVQVSATIQAVINNSSFTAHFKQITDTAFAVTGGHLARIKDTFYLVGGHKFDGRYNPMGGASYTQSYTNQVRKFVVDNSGAQLSFSGYSTITDPVHLRRRDYNLLPQIFPDGSEGYTICSGVFQLGVDLPFLYPVDIKASGHTPVTAFSQYLNNYHTASVSLYDSNVKAMHMLFFGGMSRYYYQNGNLLQDDEVPFVKTISRVTRAADGSLKEYNMPVEMPGLKGSSAEFIPNDGIDYYEPGIVKLHAINKDTTLIGHILGGILSTTINPFSDNQTGNTSADNTIYAVKLIRDSSVNVEVINALTPYEIELYPNPVKDNVHVKLLNTKFKQAQYFLVSADGRILQRGKFDARYIHDDVYTIRFKDIAEQVMQLTIVFDDEYYVTKTVSRM